MTTALDAVASRIKELDIKVHSTVRGMLYDARECGELLAEAKDTLPHGEFLPWVEQHCELSIRTAQAYLRLFRRWDEVEASNAQTSAHLSIDSALKLLAEPRDPKALPAPTAKSISPLALFDDITILVDASDVEEIVARMRESFGYVPLIDYDAAKGWWIWHSLLTPDGLIRKKPIALMYAFPEETYRDLEHAGLSLAEKRKEMGPLVWSEYLEASEHDASWVDATIDNVLAMSEEVDALCAA